MKVRNNDSFSKNGTKLLFGSFILATLLTMPWWGILPTENIVPVNCDCQNQKHNQLSNVQNVHNKFPKYKNVQKVSKVTCKKILKCKSDDINEKDIVCEEGKKGITILSSTTECKEEEVGSEELSKVVDVPKKNNDTKINRTMLSQNNDESDNEQLMETVIFEVNREMTSIENNDINVKVTGPNSQIGLNKHAYDNAQSNHHNDEYDEELLEIGSDFNSVLMTYSPLIFQHYSNSIFDDDKFSIPKYFHAKEHTNKSNLSQIEITKCSSFTSSSTCQINKCNNFNQFELSYYQSSNKLEISKHRNNKPISNLEFDYNSFEADDSELEVFDPTKSQLLGSETTGLVGILKVLGNKLPNIIDKKDVKLMKKLSQQNKKSKRHQMKKNTATKRRNINDRKVNKSDPRTKSNIPQSKDEETTQNNAARSGKQSILYEIVFFFNLLINTNMILISFCSNFVFSRLNMLKYYII